MIMGEDIINNNNNNKRAFYEIYYNDELEETSRFVNGRLQDGSHPRSTPDKLKDYVIKIYESDNIPQEEDESVYANVCITKNIYDSLNTKFRDNMEVFDFVVDDMKTPMKDLLCVSQIGIWKICPRLKTMEQKYKPSKRISRSIKSLREEFPRIEKVTNGKLVYIQDPVGVLCDQLQCSHRPTLELWLREKNVVPLDLLMWYRNQVVLAMSEYEDRFMDDNWIHTTTRHDDVYGGVATKIVDVGSSGRNVNVVRLAPKFIIIYEGMMDDKVYISKLNEYVFDFLPGKFIELYDRLGKMDGVMMRKIVTKMSLVTVQQALKSLWSNVVSIMFLPQELSRKDYMSLSFGKDVKKIKLTLGPNTYNAEAVKAGVSGVTSMEVRLVIKYRFGRRCMEDGFFDHCSTILLKM